MNGRVPSGPRGGPARGGPAGPFPGLGVSYLSAAIGRVARLDAEFLWTDIEVAIGPRGDLVAAGTVLYWILT